MFLNQIRSYLAGFSGQNLSREYTLNLIKEYLQFYVLNFIYNSSYKNIIFTGGTCMHVCYGMDRLSEDLDFDTTGKNLSVETLAQYITDQFKTLKFSEVEFSVKNKQKSIYLKFPILKALQLAPTGQSDKLYVKIDLNVNTAPTFDTDLFIVNERNLSFLIKHYDLASLFAGKLHAIFTRDFFKGRDNLVNIKGRDFYDLLWLLNKKAKPNLRRLNEMLKVDSSLSFESMNELRDLLLRRLETVNPTFIYDDVKVLFKDAKYITDVTKNYVTLTTKLIEQM